MENNGKQKIYNGVAPESVTNKVFTKTLGSVISRPTIFPVPAFIVKLIFGEMSEILITSQRVIPQEFTDEGFKFQFPSLENALRDVLRNTISQEMVLETHQWIDKPLDHVFNFFSNEKNLETITPDYLNFKVVGKSSEKIQEGTIIEYRLRLHGFPMSWSSKISTFNSDKSKFVDEQIKGPFAKWVHTHSFSEVGKGTLIKDHIVFQIPCGILGKIFAGPFVKRDLNQIFRYRKSTIDQRFGPDTK